MKVLHHPVLQNHHVPVQVLHHLVLQNHHLPVQVLHHPIHLPLIDHRLLFGYLPDMKVKPENQKVHPVMSRIVRQPIVAKAKDRQDEAEMRVHQAMKAKAQLEDRLIVLPDQPDKLIHQDQPDKVIHQDNLEILIHQDQPDKVIHHNNQIIQIHHPKQNHQIRKIHINNNQKIVQHDGKMEPNQKILFAHH